MLQRDNWKISQSDDGVFSTNMTREIRETLWKFLQPFPSELPRDEFPLDTPPEGISIVSLFECAIVFKHIKVLLIMCNGPKKLDNGDVPFVNDTSK